MTKNSSARDRAAQVHALLSRRYPENRTLLAHRNPFELLIGVILSAQTTDAQVNRATPALFAACPDAASLAAAPLGLVEELVHSTGFFRNKARNIVACAAALRDRHGGEVPRDMDALLALPGVGRKSANVIRGACFGLPAIIVDTHFGRVVRRLGLTKAENPDTVERELEDLVPPSDRTAFSMEVNFHGRDVCHARSPECGACLLREFCPSAL